MNYTNMIIGLLGNMGSFMSYIYPKIMGFDFESLEISIIISFISFFIFFMGVFDYPKDLK